MGLNKNHNNHTESEYQTFADGTVIKKVTQFVPETNWRKIISQNRFRLKAAGWRFHNPNKYSSKNNSQESIKKLENEWIKESRPMIDFIQLRKNMMIQKEQNQDDIDCPSEKSHVSDSELELPSIETQTQLFKRKGVRRIVYRNMNRFRKMELELIKRNFESFNSDEESSHEEENLDCYFSPKIQNQGFSEINHYDRPPKPSYIVTKKKGRVLVRFDDQNEEMFFTTTSTIISDLSDFEEFHQVRRRIVRPRPRRLTFLERIVRLCCGANIA